MGIFVRKKNKRKGSPRDFSSNQAQRRAKTRFARFVDRYGIKVIENNPDLMGALAMKQLGHLEEYKLYNPPPTEAPKQQTELEKFLEDMKIKLLKTAMAAIEKDPKVLNHAAMKELYSLLGLPDLTQGTEEYDDKDYDGPATDMGMFLQQLREFKQISKELGIKQKSGLSTMFTPEVLIQFMTLLTKLIPDSNKNINGNEDTGYLMVDTGDGKAQRMSIQQYNQYVQQLQLPESPIHVDNLNNQEPQESPSDSCSQAKQLADDSITSPDSGVHRVSTGNGPQGMEPTGEVSSMPDDTRPQGAEPGFYQRPSGEKAEAVEPNSSGQMQNQGGASDRGIQVELNVLEWVKWLNRDPSEFVVDLAVRAAGGNLEAQGTLDFFRAYTCDEIVGFLSQQQDMVGDADLENYIDLLLENQNWLNAMITHVHGQQLPEDGEAVT